MKPYRILANTNKISHDDWLKLRKQGIGGSDAGAIIGFNTFTSPYMVWLDKTTDYTKDLSDNEAVYWGNALEDIVAKEFERRTGKKVRRLNKVLQSRRNPFMFANIDREIVGENAILECKTTNQFLVKEWDGEDVPASYICQCQHYMAVTGAEKAYIACLIGGNKFVWKEIIRDESLIEFLILKEREFWETYVLGGKEPPVDGSSDVTEYINQTYKKSDGETVQFTSDYIGVIDERIRLKENESQIKEALDDCDNRLKAFMKTAEIGLIDKYAVSWKTIISNRVDSKKLKELYPEIYKNVIKASISRRFEIKESV